MTQTETRPTETTGTNETNETAFHNETTPPTRNRTARRVAAVVLGATALGVLGAVVVANGGSNDSVRVDSRQTATQLQNTAEVDRMLRLARPSATELHNAAEIDHMLSAADTGSCGATAGDLLRAASGARVLEAQRPELFEQTPRPADSRDLALAASWAARVPC